MSELERSPPGEACLEREPIRSYHGADQCDLAYEVGVVDRGRGVCLDQ